MNVRKKFVGREKELRAFGEFLDGKRLTKGGKMGEVLLLVGDQGMGKTALLQAMAEMAVSMKDIKHCVITGEIDKRNTEFSEQIYPLVAMLKGEKFLQLGEVKYWLKATVTGLAYAGGLFSVGASLAELLIEIRKQHKTAGSSPATLAYIFHKALQVCNDRIGGAQRIVILLDPEKESPPDLIPLLRGISNIGMPSKVRFVIAQRTDDAIINAFNGGELQEFFAEPMQLEQMNEEENQEFLKSYEVERDFSPEFKTSFLEKYGGWPLLMEMALEHLRRFDGDVSEAALRSLPSDIAGFWSIRDREMKNKESRALVHTVCLLPHPYPKERVAKFAGLKPVEMDAAWRDPAIWRLLDEVVYEETLSGQLWQGCPFFKHSTCRETILENLKIYKDLLHETVSNLIFHYEEMIGDDLERGDIDKDALIYLPIYLFKHKDWENYFSQVNRLGEVKLRYGLIDSFLSDHLMALKLSKDSGWEKGKALYAGNLGIVYEKLGDLSRANEMHTMSLKSYDAVGNEKGAAAQLMNLGIVFLKLGHIDSAEQMFAKCLEFSLDMGDEEFTAVISLNLGQLYHIKEAHKRAEIMYKKSLLIHESLGKNEGIAKCYGSLALLYKDLGEFERAEEMLKKSIEIDKTHNDLEDMVIQYTNLGTLYLDRNELDRAEKMFKEGIRIYEDQYNKRRVADLYSLLGTLYKIRGDIPQAKDSLTKSLEIFDYLGVVHDVEKIKKFLKEL